jgi:cation:H+ antiporter
MLSSLSLPILILIFIGAAAAVWIAGIRLSNTTDVLCSHFGLGEALGGLIILAIVTNLPEIAITTSAALRGNLGVAPLPQAQSSDIYLTGLGALLTAVYLYGIIFRPRLRFLRMGVDSLVVLILYVVGIAGLIAITHG